ncbi:MAG: NAD(P)/FAD-dependent oxidoreductase [Actinobacteria bacterium]|nr:NAD(P)/FAD-dependent oxidoreductase [Actinomycetota bacterium]
MGYDAVIVGAGLGGLGAGVALSAAGRKVLVLERMDFIGGRCSSRKVDGWTMDIGCHFLFGCEHGSFGDAAGRIGRKIEFFHPFNYRLKVRDSMMLFDGDSLVVTRPGADAMNIKLMDALDRMINFSPRPLVRMINLMMMPVLPRLNRIAAPFLNRMDEITIKEILDGYFKWPVVRDFCEFFQLAGFCTPSWLTSWSEGLRTMLGFIGYYRPGMNPTELMGYPVGGLQAIPDTFAEGILEHGGEIRTGVGVKRIIIEGGRAAGVELENGEVVRSNIVISNAGIKETVRDLVGNEKFDREYAERTRKLVSGVSGFTLRARMDSRISDLELGFNIPVPNVEDYFHELWDDHIIGDYAPPIMLSSPSNMDPNTCPAGKQIILAVGASMLHTDDDHRKLEKYAIESVEGLVPGFKDHIEYCDLMTPETYAAFGEDDAPIIGIAQSVGQVGRNRPSSISPIKGLFFVGGEAGRGISGVACDMATNSGLACGDYIVKNSDMNGIGKLKKAAARYIGSASVLKKVGALTGS